MVEDFSDAEEIIDIDDDIQTEQSQPPVEQPSQQPQQIQQFEQPKTIHEVRDILSGTFEESSITPDAGVIKWVYDPKDIIQNFEMYLRGMYLDRYSGKVEQLYAGYWVSDEKSETTGKKEQVKHLIPYKLMNDRGINDAISFFTLYVNRVTSMTQYDMPEIDSALSQVLFDLHERYIVYKAREFEIKSEDGYLIVNTMYNFIRSGWLQSFRGKSLNMLGKSTRVTEVFGNRGEKDKRPKWKFW